MKTHSNQLLDTIRSHASTRRKLVECLDSDANFIGVYYLTPVANLKQILISGGIRPRNLIHEPIIECSDYTVQSRRKYPINLLCADGQKIWKEIHDCVNFFLNPINDTLYQFRRNARLAAAKKNMPSYMGALSLVELDTVRLLNSQNLAWAVSDRNIASSTTCVQISSDAKQYKSFDWSHIYSIKEGQQSDNYNNVRSAEFIVHPHHGNHISTEYIHRIITFKSDAVPPEEINFDLSRLHTVYDNLQIGTFNDPLYADKKFWNNIKSLKINETIAEACNDLLSIENQIGRLLQEDFDPKSIASDEHGVGHVTRVMFWVVLLTYLSREKGFPISDDEMKTAVFAAYIHDLCRINKHDDDDRHGKVAAERSASWLRCKLPQDNLYQSCLQAVTYHCRADIPAHPDVVWQLLKDADALDRGRFVPHVQEKGCDITRLTSSIFQRNKSLAERCAWTAYWLARMTKYINWESSTVSSLQEMLQHSRILAQPALEISQIYAHAYDDTPF